MRSRMWRAGRFLVAPAVLGLVLWQTGHGAFVAGFTALDAQTVALAAAIGVPATVACAWRWHVVARALGAPVGMPPAFSSCYASQFLNSTLPAGVTGDVYRGIRHAPERQRLLGLRAVAWERLGGQAVQILLAAALLVAMPSPLHPFLPVLLALVVVLVAVLAWAARRRVLGEDLRALLAPDVLRVVLVSSLVAQCGYVLTGLLAARAVGVTVPAAQLVPLLLVVLVATALPLSVAGWGPREGAAAWCFATAGLGAGDGVSTAVAYGVMVTVASLPGALFLVLGGVRHARVPT